MSEVSGGLFFLPQVYILNLYVKTLKHLLRPVSLVVLIKAIQIHGKELDQLRFLLSLEYNFIYLKKCTQ